MGQFPSIAIRFIHTHIFVLISTKFVFEVVDALVYFADHLLQTNLLLLVVDTEELVFVNRTVIDEDQQLLLQGFPVKDSSTQ